MQGLHCFREMEAKEENSPNEIKPKIETMESEPPLTQPAPPTVIRRLQITPSGTIVENNDDQPPEASTEEVVNTSSSTPQEQSPIDRKVDLQEAGPYQEIIQQEAHEQFAEKTPYTVSIPAENFTAQGDFAEQGVSFVVQCKNS